MRVPAALWGLAFLFLLSSCLFGVDRSGGILKYDAGTVTTGKGSFTVPRLPPPWKSPKIRLKQLIHENNTLKATIVTDALCGAKFSESPLPRLARELFQNMQDVKIVSEKNFYLADRAALRVRGSGRADGVPLKMEVVVMKKDFCLYDFVYFAPPQSFAAGLKDFERYFYGFKN